MPSFLNDINCSTKILIYLLLFSFTTIITHFVAIYKKLSYEQRYYYLLIINLFLLYLAYLNEEYPVILLMILIPTVCLLFMSSLHEYLYKNFPNKFQRIASFEEKKEDFMFLPKWMLVFYSNHIYFIIFAYKIVESIIYMLKQ